MWAFLGILFFVSGIIYLYREIKFIVKVKDILIISYMRLIFCLTYGFIPALMCFMYFFDGIKVKIGTLVAVDYSLDGLIYLYLFWFFSVIAYCFLNLGYKRNIKFKMRKKQTRRKNLTQLQTAFVAFIVLILGCISLYLWTKNEGSVFNFIVKANWYRADYTNSMNNAFAMFRQPANMVTVAALLFFFLLIECDAKHRILYFVGYVVSMIASVLYLLCTDGRLQIAMFFGIQLMGFILYRNKQISIGKKQIITIGVLAVAALILISQLNAITSFIRYGEVLASEKNSSSIFMTIVNEFGFVYESGQVSIDTNLFNGGKWMILDEIVRGLFSVLPSRFTPEGFERVWRYNTFLCTGNINAGTIPCDMISEGIYTLNILGIIIVPWVWGQFARKVETAYQGRKSNAFNRAMYLGWALLFFRIINYCELYDFFRGLFAYLITYALAFALTMILNLQRNAR